jgi:predicted SprT family Zn-dependent metalloprotease
MVYEQKRGKKGKKDKKDKKDKKNKKDKKEKVIPEELYHQILYDLGKAYQRTGEGWKTHAVWSQLPQQSSNPKYQSLLNERV